MIGLRYRKKGEHELLQYQSGMNMSDTQEKLRQLLDGELDPSEISGDPVLISLAERIYGLDMKEIIGDDYENASELDSDSDLFVEIVESGDSDALPELELPELPELSAPSTPLKVPSLFLPLGMMLKYLGPAITIVSIINVLGAFSFLANSMCSGFCPVNNGRISWLDIYNLNSEYGWVETGTFGAPTVILSIFGIFLFWFGNKIKYIHASSK